MIIHNPLYSTKWNTAAFRVQLTRIVQILLILVFLSLVTGIDSGIVIAAPVAQDELVCTALDPLAISDNTGEKPQSKVWTHAGEWWSVLPTSSAARSSGTWLWKLQGTAWVEVLKLSKETSTRADVLSVGNVTHILLHDSDPQLVSVEYVSGTYQLWSTRPTSVSIPLPSINIATIDIDSTGRMWLATVSGTDIIVYYSDSPYSTWKGPLIIGSLVNTNDISMVTAMPGNIIGVLWSNQNDGYFHFRTHTDGANPAVWSTVENISASPVGTADDHINVAVASDGTLYAAVKTEPTVINANLLIRRPGGTWDSIYRVDTAGTRPIVVLNEDAGVLRVIYTDATGGGNILYKETSTSSIDFGSTMK